LSTCLSKAIPVPSSVPQGSHLGPLLFSLFINDIKKHLTVDFSLYADDLKMWKTIESSSDCRELQDNIVSLTEYCERNKLQLNVSKCSVMSFTKNTSNCIGFDYNIHNTNLAKKSEMCDLGVIFDSKLSFSAHINELYAKSTKLLGFIFRTCSDFKNTNTILTLFNSLIRSKLEYASTIWNPHSDNSIYLINLFNKGGRSMA
jgi:ribonuclease P/MRP protein subunit RPP40